MPGSWNFVGYLSYADHEIGRLVDAIHELPDADNTLIFYIVGDNGASAEGGFNGTINEVKSLSGFQTKIEDVIKHIDEIGEPNTEPHYPIGWAWAGNAPFQWVKQVASHLGGSRNPMVVTWPAYIKDKGGTGKLFINGKQVGEGRIDKTVAGRFGIDTFGVGEDTGSPVANSYKPPFAFAGKIDKVVIELGEMQKADADKALQLEKAVTRKIND